MSDSREVWEYMGKTDADWAVASAPGRRRGAWSSDLDEFYASGKRRVDEVLSRIPGDVSGAALDYGSGTGRLSFALADRFDSVTAADISQTMAATLRKRAESRRVVNVSTLDLNVEKPLPKHSVAICLITLQHLQSMENVDRALCDIAGGLIAGGYALVDFPTPPQTMRQRLQPRYRAYRALRRCHFPQSVLDRMGFSGISMLYESVGAFKRRLERAGLESIDFRLAPSEFSEMSTYLARRSA